MRHTLILILSFLSLSCVASAQRSLLPLYDKLDSMLSLYPKLIAAKQHRLNVISQTLDIKRLSSEEIYAINNRLYNEYSTFCFDSAFKYVERNIVLSKKMRNVHLYYSSTMQKIHILSVSGLFEEAISLLKGISKEKLSKDELLQYYKLCDDLYLYMAQFCEGTPYYNYYQDKADFYRQKSFALASPASFEYAIAKSRYLNNAGKRDEALRLASKMLLKCNFGTREYSRMAASIAYFYGLNHESVLQKKYLILSAMSDIKGVIRETSSMRKLATALFKEGDVNRAYQYLMVSIHDAQFFHTRLRDIQSTQQIPTIASAYHQKEMKTNNRLRIMLVVTGFIILVLIAEMVFIARLIRRTRKANSEKTMLNSNLKKIVQELNEMNVEITQTNLQLDEANKIKEEYITRFLELASTFIEDITSYKKNLVRTMNRHDLESLNHELKSNRLIDSMTDTFYENFDSAFLNIYPNFISEVNKLLVPEKRLVLKNGERMNTELRMLALLRLGIFKVPDMAAILHSSVPTIYSYRSRLKALALSPTDFEDNIKKIG